MSDAKSHVAQWARETGFFVTEDGIPCVRCADGSWLNLEYKLGALIERARIDALEEAARLLEIDGSELAKFYASEIRTLSSS